MLSKLILPLLFVCLSCRQKSLSGESKNERLNNISQVINLFNTISEIPIPQGYERNNYSPDAFASWLRNIKLKNDKTVYKYDGTPKYNQIAQFAVLNISVGKQNLQQCADAVMRLRAEYFYDRKDFNKISFTDNNGRSYYYQPPFTRDHFNNYLLKVFGMCGTASLSKQLKKDVQIKDIESGDVLIRGGFPGHAVIVIDVAINKGGKKIYLLAQSYMPAQDIHVLINPVNKNLSPWYEVNDESIIETPEYNFTKYELKRW